MHSHKRFHSNPFANPQWSSIQLAKRRLEDVEESLERARKMADVQSDESHEALRRLQEEKDDVDRQMDLLRKNVRG